MPKDKDKDERKRRIFDLFDEFDELFRDLEEMLEKDLEDLEEEFREVIRSSSKGAGGPYYYGIRIYVGPDGVPKIERFGNIKRSGKSKVIVSEETEPMVDVIEQGDEIWIVADMPGVDKDKINIDATEDRVLITAQGENRSYRKEVELPAPVDPNSAKATYKNGVLEIKFKKKSSGGVKVKVE